jgi:hypothetical protein
MNKHLKPPSLCASSDTCEREDVLSVLRLVSVRLGGIRDEVNDIGIALKNGRIDPNYARALVDRVAPGCFDMCAGDILQ